MRLNPLLRSSFWLTVVLLIASLYSPRPASAGVTREEVEKAIHAGVRYLKKEQRDDGSWADVENDARTGVTSMVTLALLTTGERPDSPTIKKALDYLRGFTPNDLHSTYAIALQTMVFAAADPATDELRIAPMSTGSKRRRSSRAIRSSGRARGAIRNRSGAGPAIIRTPSTRSWGCMPPARSASR